MITKDQVMSAQEEWGAGVVKIGSLKLLAFNALNPLGGWYLNSPPAVSEYPFAPVTLPANVAS